MTPRQLEVLRYIERVVERSGCAPTLQEIADHLGINKVTALSHVRALERARHIRRHRYGRRAIEVLTTSRRLPVLGRISAGRPIEAVEAEDADDIRELIAGGDDLFSLRVRGDSMIEDRIADGDYVIVERRETARDGEIVVAVLENGEATLKRIHREHGRIRLQPANAAMQPLIVDRVSIRGVVVGIYRRL